MPMTGSSASTMPMLIIIWTMSQTVTPAGGVADERVVGAGGDPDRRRRRARGTARAPAGADQAELLAEHGEDEVGVRLGQAAPLLLAGADARRRTSRRSASAYRPWVGLPAGAAGSRLNGSSEVGRAGRSRSGLVTTR